MSAPLTDKTNSSSSGKTDIGSAPASGNVSGNASLIVSIAILLSRILGLVRQKVFAHYLGNSAAAGAFNAALRIPNFLQNLFGEGILSASFIPVYAHLRAQGDHETARRVAGIVGALLALLVSILVLMGVGLTPWLVDLVAPGFEGDLKLLTIRIVRILFPGVGLLVLSAWCLGILNSHRKFFLSYIAPVFWNSALIATLLFFGSRSGQNDLVIALAWGSVVGSLLQFGIQVPFVFKYGGRIRPSFDASLKPAREVFRNFGPVLVSRGVVQLSAYIDGMIASFLGAAAVASIAYAQLLYLLPISLFGMAVAAAELPEMSATSDASEDAHRKLRTRIQAGRRRIAFFVIPSAVVFLLLGQHVVALLYQSGEFGTEDTLYVWYILMGSVVGLLAATWGRLYSSAFYALRDTRTPLGFAIVRVTLTVVLGLAFAFPLRGAFVTLFSTLPFLRLPALKDIDVAIGAVGLTSSAGFAGWVEFLALKHSLERRIGSTKIAANYLFKIWLAALLAAAVALIVPALIMNSAAVEAPSVARHAQIRALLSLAIFTIAYFSLAATFKLDELRALQRRLFKRR